MYEVRYYLNASKYEVVSILPTERLGRWKMNQLKLSNNYKLGMIKMIKC